MMEDQPKSDVKRRDEEEVLELPDSSFNDQDGIHSHFIRGELGDIRSSIGPH